MMITERMAAIPFVFRHSSAILVVGDGNFSFSVALAKENKVHGNANIIASCLDSKDVVEAKYSKCKNNLKFLDLDSNVYVKYGLNVTQLGSLGEERIFIV